MEKLEELRKFFEEVGVKRNDIKSIDIRPTIKGYIVEFIIKEE